MISDRKFLLTKTNAQIMTNKKSIVSFNDNFHKILSSTFENGRSCLDAIVAMLCVMRKMQC